MPKHAVTYLYLVIALFIFAGCSPNDAPNSMTADKHFDEEGNENTYVSDPTMTVHFIDVGQADASLAQFTDEEGKPYTLLIDTGNWNATDVVSYLQSKQITSIDVIAITHPHADHIGQLDKIIETFDVAEVWMNGEIVNSEIFDKALAAIEAHGIDYYEPEAGDIFDIGPVEVTVLHPDTLSSNTNDNSLALRLQFGDISFLFTGDGEEKAEQEMLAGDGELKSTVLHLGHHGSDTSTTVPFLHAVNPEIAIYSAGRENQYNHPHEDIVDRIRSEEILLYGTDTQGTIRVVTDGTQYAVQTDHPSANEQNSTAHSKNIESAASVEETFSLTSTESCININEASESEIQQIVHIGPDRAQSLIDQRPFESIDQLIDLEGIGPARMKDIKVQGIACIGDD